MIAIKQMIEEYTAINIKTTHPNWDDGTTYSFGDIRFYNHYYYRSVVDNNIGNIPSESEDEWLRWSVSNRYAQIDLRATTYTEWNSTTATVPADNALISTFVNNSYDTVALGGVTGETVKIEVYNHLSQLVHTEENVVYSRPYSNNWYGYYFDLFLAAGNEASFLFRIPPISGGYITVTVTPLEGVVKVGYMIGGHEIYIGDSLFGVSLGIEDNSLIEIDDFGITTVVKRTANNFMDIDVIFPSYQVKQMERKAIDLSGNIVLFVGDESTDSIYEHLATLGYVENYTTVLSNPIKTTASYSVKEVI